MKLVLALCAAALAWSASAAGSPRQLTPPAGLHAFDRLATDPVAPGHTYAQMPAFAWSPARGATDYELQIATSRTFDGGSTFVDRKGLRAPVASVDRQVPWLTGQPYALWARVRSRNGASVSAWSSPFGFNMEWRQLPRRLPSPPGLLRWSPVEGATAYDVWLVNAPGGAVHVRTLTNVADEREYWPAGPATVEWRVRAVRSVDPQALPDGIHAESHGPYTELFETSRGGAGGVHAISFGDSTPARPAATALMPGFSWSSPSGAGLSRVYVFSDRRCVNAVTVGTVVAGPAWAPRAQTTPADDPGAGAMADGTQISATSEEAFGAGAAGAGSPAAAPAAAPGAAGPAGAPAASGAEPDPGHIALPDNGWPTGRYWWTVVPVGSDLQDAELPQDACSAGRVWQFGMESTPVVTHDQAPFASGLAGARVTASATPRPAFDQLPLITWGGALGAQGYQVQLSRKRYPWTPRFTLESSVTSATLPLTKRDRGTWYYRVRGLNGNLPGSARTMTWSQPVAIRITGDRFVVAG